jgi:hypothetical protein
MSLTIAGIESEHHVYDERADVLYLTVAGYEGSPADADATRGPRNRVRREAEGDRDDARERKWLLDRDGELTIIWPSGHVNADELAAALASTA